MRNRKKDKKGKLQFIGTIVKPQGKSSIHNSHYLSRHNLSPLSNQAVALPVYCSVWIIRHQGKRYEPVLCSWLAAWNKGM